MTNESLHIYTRSKSADSTRLWGEKITAKKQFPAIVRKIIRKQTRMKGERSLEFNKIQNVSKGKLSKDGSTSLTCATSLPTFLLQKQQPVKQMREAVFFGVLLKV